MSTNSKDYYDRLTEFITQAVFPAEAEYHSYRSEHGAGDHNVPPVVERLKSRARDLGLWNLFLPSESGLTNVEYAPLAELSGWSMEIAPEALNCAAPDTGNMETLHLFADDEQRERWLKPLLNGSIRSAFAGSSVAIIGRSTQRLSAAEETLKEVGSPA